MKDAILNGGQSLTTCMDGSCYAVVIHKIQSSYEIIQVNEFVCLCAGNKNSFDGLVDPIINS